MPEQFFRVPDQFVTTEVANAPLTKSGEGEKKAKAPPIVD